jgi:hypothetical protein
LAEIKDCKSLVPAKKFSSSRLIKANELSNSGLTESNGIVLKDAVTLTLKV